MDNIAAASSEITLAEAGLVAVLGYGVVFLGLIVLMFVVIALGKAFVASAKRKQEASAAAAPAQAAEVAKPEVAAPVAPGSAGGVKLHDVEPKTAAMLMAIVADKMGKPLNELRFISIKEVK